MNLSTTYMGLQLTHPFMCGASPMTENIDTVKQLEDAGASAIVMHSLFEEQILLEEINTLQDMEGHAESFAESLSYFPEPADFRLGPDEYLEQIGRIKKSVKLPLIASLNGTTAGGWIRYARLIEEAGANALELNVFYMAADMDEKGEAVEQRTLDILQAVKGTVKIPVGVKLSPFYSSLANFSKALDENGADAIILFNRFYQPDIDIEIQEAVPTLQLTDSSKLLVRIRWLAALSGRLKASIALSGGVHTHLDAVKAVMAGADTVQIVSALLRRGPAYLRDIISGVAEWLENHEYESLQQMKGSMSLEKCPDPSSFMRGNYARILQSWTGEQEERKVVYRAAKS